MKCQLSIGRNARPWKASPAESAARGCCGERTPVKALFENLEAGMSIEEVIEQFPVTRAQMDSLMAFVARSLEKAPSYGPELQVDRRRDAGSFR